MSCGVMSSAALAEGNSRAVPQPTTNASATQAPNTIRFMASLPNQLFGALRVVHRTETGQGAERAAASRYIEKLVPQPQEAVAWGFLILKAAPIRSSTKSISEPAR